MSEVIKKKLTEYRNQLTELSKIRANLLMLSREIGEESCQIKVGNLINLRANCVKQAYPSLRRNLVLAWVASIDCKLPQIPISIAGIQSVEDIKPNIELSARILLGDQKSWSKAFHIFPIASVEGVIDTEIHSDPNGPGAGASYSEVAPVDGVGRSKRNPNRRHRA